MVYLISCTDFPEILNTNGIFELIHVVKLRIFGGDLFYCLVLIGKVDLKYFYFV